ncbi:MAG TPA: hypothetical protein PK251_14165 [Candidatus Latescibacteria bacterium]|nr:hypothetical protein [Candidatus Latescibacterota bacterium]HPK75716.1 hypothetical protein [Candidatus Latescibacterota bacterium]
MGLMGYTGPQTPVTPTAAYLPLGRHSRAGGNPEKANQKCRIRVCHTRGRWPVYVFPFPMEPHEEGSLDSRLRGNDDFNARWALSGGWE